MNKALQHYLKNSEYFPNKTCLIMGNTEQAKGNINKISQSTIISEKLPHCKETKQVPGSKTLYKEAPPKPKCLQTEADKESPRSKFIKKQPYIETLRSKYIATERDKKPLKRPNFTHTPLVRPYKELKRESSPSKLPIKELPRTDLLIKEQAIDGSTQTSIIKNEQTIDSSTQTNLINNKETIDSSTQTSIIKKKQIKDGSTQTNLIEKDQIKDDIIIKEQTHPKEQISIVEIEDELDRAQEHLTTYFNSIKQKHINKLLITINEIESAYENSYKRNVSILQLLQKIIYDHDRSNIMNNYIINPFNIYKYNESSTANDLIKYFNEYSIRNSISFTPIKTIEKSSGYNSLLLLKDKRIASCSNDYSIKVFNPFNHSYCDEKIEKDCDSINSICSLDDGTIVSCSLDYSIKIGSFTIKKAHDDYIFKVIAISDDRIASCSRDNTIKIWRSNSATPIKVLEGQHAISLLYIKERNILISGGILEELRLWDMSTYQCGKIGGVFCGYINALCQIESNRVIVGGMYTINIVNIDSYVIEKTIKNNELGYVHCFLKFRNSNTILCGCGKGIFCCYDIITEEYKISYNNHSFQINDMLLIDECHFISCSKEIKLWKYY